MIPTLFILAGVVGVLLLVWMYVSSKKLLTPLRTISENLEKLSLGMPVSPLPIGRNNQYGQIISSINRLIVQLASQREQLNRLEKVRQEFVANASHELRTPISAIQGFVETLLEGAVDDPAHNRKFLGIIERNVFRLKALVDDMLSLASIENTVLGSEKVAIKATLRQLLDDMGLDQDPRIIVKMTGTDVTVVGDASEIRSAFQNYISNALKYCPERSVTITLVCEPSEISFSVHDEGVGIETSAQARLFERFYRSDADRSREQGGTGLGLAIVKHVVEKYGGKVSVESTLGEGATFGWIVPVSRNVT